MIWTGSKQFVYGAATLAVLVVLVVGLIAFFGGIGQPTPGSALQPLAPGTYVTTITLEDTSNYGTVGTWELTLAEDNLLGHVCGRGALFLDAGPDRVYS
jgi:hypothetical protein